MAAHYLRRGALAAIALGLLQGQDGGGCNEVREATVKCGAVMNVLANPGDCLPLPKCQGDQIVPNNYLTTGQYNISVGDDFPTWASITKNSVQGVETWHLCAASDAVLGAAASFKLDINEDSLPESYEIPVNLEILPPHELEIRNLPAEVEVETADQPTTVATAYIHCPSGDDQTNACIPGVSVNLRWSLSFEDNRTSILMPVGAEVIEQPLEQPLSGFPGVEARIPARRPGNYMVTLFAELPSGAVIEHRKPFRVTGKGITTDFIYEGEPNVSVAEEPTRMFSNVELTFGPGEDINVKLLSRRSRGEYEGLVHSWETVFQAKGATGWTVVNGIASQQPNSDGSVLELRDLGEGILIVRLITRSGNVAYDVFERTFSMRMY